MTSLPTNGAYFTLVSKAGAGPSDYGWELRLVRSDTKYALAFVGSLDGMTCTTVTSAGTAVTASTWYYFAATWNLGNVKLYFGTTSPAIQASVTIGTPAAAKIYNSPAPLRLGANRTSGTSPSLWLTGSTMKPLFGGSCQRNRHRHLRQNANRGSIDSERYGTAFALVLKSRRHCLAGRSAFGNLTTAQAENDGLCPRVRTRSSLVIFGP